MQRRRLHTEDGLYFTRHPDGDVTISKTDGRALGQGGIIVFEQTLPVGSWVSAVLSMTAHDERPGDWSRFIDHHQGNVDLLAEDHARAGETQR